MNLSDRAREALNKATPGPWEYGELTCTVFAYRPGQAVPVPLGEAVAESVGDADGQLIELAPQLAAEVVRLHDRLAALADELDEDADDLGEGGGYEYRDAAARIRALKEDQ